METVSQFSLNETLRFVTVRQVTRKFQNRMMNSKIVEMEKRIQSS